MSVQTTRSLERSIRSLDNVIRSMQKTASIADSFAINRLAETLNIADVFRTPQMDRSLIDSMQGTVSAMNAVGTSRLMASSLMPKMPKSPDISGLTDTIADTRAMLDTIPTVDFALPHVDAANYYPPAITRSRRPLRPDRLLDMDDVDDLDVDDLMDQAEYLLGIGWLVPAAAAAGAALQQGLEELASRHTIKLKSREDLNSLGDKLLQAKVIDDISRRQLSLIAGVRNAADHGRVDKLTQDRVERMIRDARDFLAKHST